MADVLCQRPDAKDFRGALEDVARQMHPNTRRRLRLPCSPADANLPDAFVFRSHGFPPVVDDHDDGPLDLPVPGGG
jgi:hypothetical protein